jgi:hypothetical protein
MSFAFAEQRRNVRIGGMSDRELLELLCCDDDVRPDEYAILASMRAQVLNHLGEQDGHLSKKQRAWCEEVARRIVPLDSREVTRGRPVETPSVLQHLPKKPPRRVVDD